MRAIRLLPEILEDIAQAAKWYDAQGFPGLGDHFPHSATRRDLQSCLQRIQADIAQTISLCHLLQKP
jgi:hypothetical protein